MQTGVVKPGSRRGLVARLLMLFVFLSIHVDKRPEATTERKGGRNHG